MKIAHLLLVHDNPLQVEILVSRLAHPDADIYIHLDKKRDQKEFKFLADRYDVRFIKTRVNVNWGTYSCLQCTLNGITEIAETGNSYAYLNLLSGRCLPVKPITDFHQFLVQNNGKSYMHSLNLEKEWQEGMVRLGYHDIGFFYNGLGRYKLSAWLGKIYRRKKPAGVVFYGRSQWFTIPMEQAQYVFNFLRENSLLRRFFKLTWGSDEIVFQTILQQSPFAKTIVNNNLRYIDWTEKKPSPKILSMKDKGAIVRSDAFFARKFDLTKDDGIITDLGLVTESGQLKEF